MCLNVCEEAMNKCNCKRSFDIDRCYHPEYASTCYPDKSGAELVYLDLQDSVWAYGDEDLIPDDYETCWECGYDHEYEPDHARRYHLAHQECQPRE